MTENRLSYLFYKVVDGTASPAEKSELAQLSLQPEYEAELLELMNEGWETFIAREEIFSAGQSSSMLRQALSQDDQKATAPVHRIHFLKTAWFRYAAAIILFVGLGAYFAINSRNDKDIATADSDKQLQTEISPGGEKAILTLANGSKIILDKAANGALANQGGVQVIKLANGQIAYDLKGQTAREVMWNTMSTPKGGQYQVTLPDGTKVWLNAASSITFPTAFAGDKRQVKIEGEIYFEVAKNKQKPFIVDVDGKSLVEVLGTSFNINSYADEGSIKTTLLEGSVKVTRSPTTSVPASPGSQQSSSVILLPGQQAMIAVPASSERQSDKTTGITVRSDANLAQIMAWKNGIFDFNGADLKTVMRQIERWYDIKVQYKGSVSNMTFEGKMYRNVNFSDVLEALQKMGVKFKLEGKDLIVL